MGVPVSSSLLLLCGLFDGALSFRSAQDLGELSWASPWESSALQRQLVGFDSFGAPDVEEDGSGLTAYLFAELMKKCEAANTSKLGEARMLNSFSESDDGHLASRSSLQTR